jgi:hypothetical protein
MYALTALISLLLVNISYGFMAGSSSGVMLKSAFSTSRLFAHHPQKKIIKKKQDKRPKKHRLSDINRKNINFGKCITKIEGAPSDYTIISAADFAVASASGLSFWETGSLSTKWLDITAEDMVVSLPQNREPLPVGGVQKQPRIVKSGSC